MEAQSPNEALTPMYIGERLVMVPVALFYLGVEAVRQWVDVPDAASDASETSPDAA